MSDPQTAALAAYWRFFEGCNTGNSLKFTETLNFPHVRVSGRGWARIVPDAETHARNNSFESLLAMSWDHTVGAEPEVLHVAAHKVHFPQELRDHIRCRGRARRRYDIDRGGGSSLNSLASSVVPVSRHGYDLLARDTVSDPCTSSRTA